MSITLIQQFVETICQWDGVNPTSHRFEGTEFKFGRVEVGHIHHGNGMVDIPFTVKVREALVHENLAQHHHMLEDSGWITFFIHDDADLNHAIWLMRLSYLQKTSRRYPVDTDTVDKLEMSDLLKQVTFPKLYATSSI